MSEDMRECCESVADERHRKDCPRMNTTRETLWIIEIDERAAVWAESAEEAERIVREARRYPERVEGPTWRLHVRPAPVARWADPRARRVIR